MLNMTPLHDAGRAAKYFGQGDGGYYLDGSGLRREWGGKGAPLLGLTGSAGVRAIRAAPQGLASDHRRAVDRPADRGPAGGLGLHRQPAQGCHGRPSSAATLASCRCSTPRADEAMEDVQALAMTRVRKGGRDADRVTGMMAWLVVEHARPGRSRIKACPKAIGA